MSKWVDAQVCVHCCEPLPLNGLSSYHLNSGTGPYCYSCYKVSVSNSLKNCICDLNPATTDGPDYDCPQHGANAPYFPSTTPEHCPCCQQTAPLLIDKGKTPMCAKCFSSVHKGVNGMNHTGPKNACSAYGCTLKAPQWDSLVPYAPSEVVSKVGNQYKYPGNFKCPKCPETVHSTQTVITSYYSALTDVHHYLYKGYCHVSEKWLVLDNLMVTSELVMKLKLNDPPPSWSDFKALVSGTKTPIEEPASTIGVFSPGKLTPQQEYTAWLNDKHPEDLVESSSHTSGGRKHEGPFSACDINACVAKRAESAKIAKAEAKLVKTLKPYDFYASPS